MMNKIKDLKYITKTINFVAQGTGPVVIKLSLNF